MFENNSYRHFTDFQIEVENKKAIIRKEQTVDYLIECSMNNPKRYKNIAKMINFFIDELKILWSDYTTSWTTR